MHNKKILFGLVVFLLLIIIPIVIEAACYTRTCGVYCSGCPASHPCGGHDLDGSYCCWDDICIGGLTSYCYFTERDPEPSCNDYCSGDTRYYNGDTSCTNSGWSSCSYSTENCNAYDWCYSYGSGCEERNYYCRSSDVSCQYTVSDRHTDSSCSNAGCSADKCEITRTFLDYDCHWTSQCTATTESCSSINCPSGTACSGGSCSSGNSCGTANCLSDRCVGMTFYDYPDTCNKKCDGSGNCNGCPAGSCDPTTEECTASGCCEPTCSASGGCGSIRDDSNCPPYCSGDTRYYNGDCGTGCTCSDYSTENCANKDDSCGAGGCSSGKRPNWGCSGGNCVVESCSCSSACCCDSWENQLCGASCGTAGTCAANERCQHRDCCSECSYSEWRCVSDTSCTIDCSTYGNQISCNADANCAWCTGDNTCKNVVNVECQPPSCSDDDLCTASCTWQDCGTQSCPADGCSGSTYNDYPATCNKGCSGGSCQACTCTPTPHICSQSGNWDADAIACNCDCGGYDVEESEANGNCGDGIDNDCDGNIDGNDPDCPIECYLNSDCDDNEYCTIDTCINPGTPASFCSHSNRPDGTDCGNCKICSSGVCVDKTKPSCKECQSGPFCNPVTDNWYCTNKGLCEICSNGYCDGSGNCIANPCGTCKYCSSGSCINRADGYNDCGAGCQRCVGGSCQDYNFVCSGTTSSCYCSADSCRACSSSGCCDVSCSSYTCLLSPNNGNCLSNEVCNGLTCNCDTVCNPGEVCFRDTWKCNGACERWREIYVWNSVCSCVLNSNETRYAPSGQHCSGGAFTTAGYCGSSSDYCTQDRYRKVDRYECGNTHVCNLYDFTEDLQDCGATSYSCPTSCTRRYTKTCENGICGTYNVDTPCPLDTSCSGGSCSVNYECSTGIDECISSCEKGKEQRRCDGSGNCNRFWSWLGYELCDPFSCLTGSCSNICDDDCGAEPVCDGKIEGESCGIGRECQNCQCVVVACEGYYDETSCSLDPTCAWCSGDNTCKDAISVECQPPSCSGDSHSRCTSGCRWDDCGSSDGSCYCSGGSCRACSEPTPRCLNYQCVECISNNDCECYEKCNDLLLNICYDLRYECDDGSTGIGCGIEGTCEYFDSCNSLACASNPEFCFNADPSLCKDSFSRCHVLRSCA